MEDCAFELDVKGEQEFATWTRIGKHILGQGGVFAEAQSQSVGEQWIEGLTGAQRLGWEVELVNISRGCIHLRVQSILDSRYS